MTEVLAVGVQAGWGSEMGRRQDAADELAICLKKVADALASRGMRPRGVRYGPPQVAGLFKRRSPRGFVLKSSGGRAQVLLPDGRLWNYHERSTIEGTYYDARTDHDRSMHGPIPLDGGRFSFLGAVVGDYQFGYWEGPDLDGFEVVAIVGRQGMSPQYIAACDAFTHIMSAL